MDSCTLVSTLVGVGERYATSTDDFTKLVCKVFILSLKYVNQRSLWEAVLGEEYVDWSLVEKTQGNVLGDIRVWISLIQFCSWDSMHKHEAEIALNYLCVSNIRKNLKSVGLDAGGERSWTLASEALLFSLLKGVPTLHALEMLTCGEFKRDTGRGCMELLAKQADTQYTPGEVEKSIKFMLSHLKVDALTLQQNRVLALSRREEKKLCLKQRSTVTVQGRVRLRDKIRAEFKTNEAKTQADIMLNTWDSFQGWQYTHSFPITLSENVKRKLYFMASQVHWAWKDYLPVLLSSSGPILEKVAQYPVSQPDQEVILSVINSLRMDGSSPFPELVDFRSVGLHAIPASHINRIPLTDILRAYVSAYQAPSIWNECFRSIVGVISVQIVRDIDSFVKTRPFAAEAFMGLITKS